MKIFIIHINNKKSIDYANVTLNSFDGYSSWEPELFNGVEISTLPDYEKQFPLKVKQFSRAKSFKEQSTQSEKQKKHYLTKKSCSMNHYRLFKKCVELNEPIAVVEHDAHCIGDWNNIEFEDIIVLNAQSAINQTVFDNIRRFLKPIPQGLQDLQIDKLRYTHDPEINGAYLIPGTAAYAVTPQGAKKMIEVYENIGWEQSDFIINTAYVRIQTITPELFTFKLPNLQMSHG